MRAFPAPVVVLSTAAFTACLPGLPGPSSVDTDPSSTTAGDGESGLPPGSTSGGADLADTTADADSGTTGAVDPTTGSGSGSGSGDSDGSSDTGEPGGCSALDPLQLLAGDAGASNCHVLARFDPTGSQGLLELGAPGAGPDNLLYDGDPAGQNERLASTLLFDMTNGSVASWSGVQPAAPNTTYVMQTGPAVYRIHVTSQVVDAAGPNGPTNFSTSTIYTVIADGRIVRDDGVAVVETPTTALWLLNYIALAAVPFTNFQWVGPGADDVPVSAGGPLMGFTELRPPSMSGPVDWACLYHAAEGRAVGVGLFNATATDVPPLGPRASLVQHADSLPSATSATLQVDWVRNAAIPAATSFASEQLMVVGTNPDEPCAAIDAYHRAYLGAGTMTWDAGYVAVGEYSGGEGSSGTHFSPGGGFYWAAVPPTITEDLVVHLDDAVEQPTLLLYVADLTEESYFGVSVGGNELDEADVIVQPAALEADGGVWALDEGLWVLIGVPVAADQSIVIHTQR